MLASAFMVDFVVGQFVCLSTDLFVWGKASSMSMIISFIDWLIDLLIFRLSFYLWVPVCVSHLLILSSNVCRCSYVFFVVDQFVRLSVCLSIYLSICLSEEQAFLISSQLLMDLRRLSNILHRQDICQTPLLRLVLTRERTFSLSSLCLEWDPWYRDRVKSTILYAYTCLFLMCIIKAYTISVKIRCRYLQLSFSRSFSTVDV